MSEPHAAPPGAGPQSSPDGRWRWDGQRWAPATDAGQSGLIRPPQEPAPPRGSPGSALVLALGIGSLVLAVAGWFFTFTFRITRLADIILAVLVVAGFVAGILAVVLGLMPARRPRGSGLVAGLICGLIGMGLLLLFVGGVLITYP